MTNPPLAGARTRRRRRVPPRAWSRFIEPFAGTPNAGRSSLVSWTALS